MKRMTFLIVPVGFLMVTGTATCVGLLAREEIYRRRRDDHINRCAIAHKCGVEGGHRLYELEALTRPPKRTRLVGEFDAGATKKRRAQMNDKATELAYAHGLVDGWWEAADRDVFEEAHLILRAAA